MQFFSTNNIVNHQYSFDLQKCVSQNQNILPYFHGYWENKAVIFLVFCPLINLIKMFTVEICTFDECNVVPKHMHGRLKRPKCVSQCNNNQSLACDEYTLLRTHTHREKERDQHCDFAIWKVEIHLVLVRVPVAFSMNYVRNICSIRHRFIN